MVRVNVEIHNREYLIFKTIELIAFYKQLFVIVLLYFSLGYTFN